jgi:hypothetical protein
VEHLDVCPRVPGDVEGGAVSEEAFRNRVELGFGDQKTRQKVMGREE